MLNQLKQDRLLFLTRVALTLLLGLTLVLGVVALVAIPVMFLNLASTTAGLAETRIEPAVIPWIAVLLGLASALAALGFFFFRHLRRIVDSVSEGDPFIPVNADRLRAMAWLSLGVQAILFVMTPLVVWFDALPFKPNVHHGSDGLSVGALVIALLLFVLARVFRVGADMREELEGTV